MSIYQHGVTESDVVSEYPRQRGSEITETSQGINLPLVRRLITSGSALVNTALESNGYSDIATQLTDNARAITSQAIVAYAIWHCLLRVGAREEAATWQGIWDEHLKTLRQMPEYLGSAQNSSDQVISNVSTTPKKKHPFGRDFQGW